MGELFSTVIEGLADLIYPPKCLVCGEFDEPWFCNACLSKVERVPMPYCDHCGHPLLSSSCQNCLLRRHSFEFARAAGEYSGVLREAIHQFKYHGHRMLAPSLAGLLHKYMMTRCDVSYNSVDLILPVPIHDAKRRLRGYNQSQLLAAELSGLCGIPGEWKAVKRRASAHAQVELSRSERLRNVQGAFRVVLPEVIRGKRILLIDDVATTCSTVHECSLALLDAGASRVYVLCLAFGS